MSPDFQKRFGTRRAGLRQPSIVAKPLDMPGVEAKTGLPSSTAPIPSVESVASKKGHRMQTFLVRQGRKQRQSQVGGHWGHFLREIGLF